MINGCAWNFGDDKDVPLKSRGVLCAGPGCQKSGTESFAALQKHTLSQRASQQLVQYSTVLPRRRKEKR